MELDPCILRARNGSRMSTSTSHETSPTPSAPPRLLHEIQVERKVFLFAMGENPRGRFLKITEDVNGRRDTIILPTSGLNDFRRVLDQVAASLEQGG